MYLQEAGVRREVIGTLAGFGLCHDYTTGLQSAKKVAEHKKIRHVCRSESSETFCNALQTSDAVQARDFADEAQPN
jgi:hypothetical protein